MLTLLVAIIGLVVSLMLFRVSMPPRSGGKRWFIETRWEAYIVVFLVCGLMMSLGFLALSIADLLT